MATESARDFIYSNNLPSRVYKTGLLSSVMDVSGFEAIDACIRRVLFSKTKCKRHNSYPYVQYTDTCSFARKGTLPRAGLEIPAVQLAGVIDASGVNIAPLSVCLPRLARRIQALTHIRLTLGFSDVIARARGVVCS